MKALFSFWVLLGVTVILIISGKCSKSNSQSISPEFISDQPALQGRLIFHSYSCYSCNDSKLILYDFKQKKLSVISDSWNITNPMNAHFSPDGKSIVFMGIASTTGWDIFRWRIGSDKAPQNLTSSFGNTRDEDPKYSFDGLKIIFKQNGIIKEIDTAGHILNSFTLPNSEASMPYYAKGDSVILYSGNESGGKTSDIYKLSLHSGSVLLVAGNKGVEEYYPIVRDDTSFLFTRWYSVSDYNDQVYLGFLDGRSAQRLSVNETGANFSDPFPVNDRYIILSSTKNSGVGGYDLYLADIVTGKKWSLDLYQKGINSTKEELGVSYIQ
ncbi:MAG: hypothetical protein QM725_04470 [Lacibacter sp.]